jgi:hypothetical protein
MPTKCGPPQEPGLITPPPQDPATKPTPHSSESDGFYAPPGNAGKALNDAWTGTPNGETTRSLMPKPAPNPPQDQRRRRPVDPLKRTDLTGLSKVMGALHALRVSCSGRGDQTYRSRMATLLYLEAPDNGGQIKA